jgi:hypothetical protein
METTCTRYTLLLTNYEVINLMPCFGVKSCINIVIQIIIITVNVIVLHVCNYSLSHTTFLIDVIVLLSMIYLSIIFMLKLK